MNLFNQLKAMNILLVDDDEWIRDSMRLFFEGEGCRLKTYETAEEAIERLKRDKYDIIFIDYKLPGMDGLSFLRRIEKLQPVAVKILITAYGHEAFDKAKQLKVDDIIIKPFTSDDILKSLNQFFKNYPEKFAWYKLFRILISRFLPCHPIISFFENLRTAISHFF